MTLERVYRLDSVKLDSTYFTEEGYLVDTPIVTSCGIFEYKNPDGSIRRELRLPEHVFDEKSLATYEGKPVIITHDAGLVNKRNVEDEIVGTILSMGYRDGEDVRAKIIIHGIDEVKKSGFRELSLGYELVLDETPGEWKGHPYDAIQTEIAINHLALVRDARAGEHARLNIDGETQILTGGNTMNNNELKKTVSAYNERRRRRLDETEQSSENKDSPQLENETATGDNEPPLPPAENNPEDKVKLIKDRRDRRDQEGDPENPETAMGVIAQQDEDINTLLEIIEGLQAKSDFDNAAAPATAANDENEDNDEGDNNKPEIHIHADAMDAIVRERLKLGRLGDSLNLDGLEEMKPIDAKKAVIKKVNPGMRLDGKSKTYINAAFDAAVAQINTSGGGKDCNYQRRQMSNRADSRGEYAATGKTSASRARERMIERQMNGGNE